MALKYHSPLFLILSLLLFVASPAARELANPDAWKPITDPKSREVVEAGMLAVDKYNEFDKANLKFGSVINGAYTDIRGGNDKLFWLLFTAVDGNATDEYEGTVYEKALPHSVFLYHFNKR